MFKDRFKYYKSKKPPPDLRDVLDFNRLENSTQVKKVFLSFSNNFDETPFGLKPQETWEVFQICSRPGLIFIKNPFKSIGQRCWTIKCLKKYSKNTFKRNIDALNILNENDDWWEESQDNDELRNKLRWTTLGYHHNWDTKMYSEQDKGEFPKDLKYLTGYIAFALGYANYSAEAAIINYYHMDSTLSGHTDHSEQNLCAPLFSFSFGQTAIFLIGGKTKEEAPTPIFLRSGDIVVMSKESRLSYHGVPKILPADSEPWNDKLPNDLKEKNSTVIMDEDEMNICFNDSLWQPFSKYLLSSRINMNVRQVRN